MAKPSTTAARRAAAPMELDAAGAAIVGAADMDVSEPIEKSATEIRGCGLNVPAGAANNLRAEGKRDACAGQRHPPQVPRSSG